MGILRWILALIIAVIFGQSLYFKFTGAPESLEIFTMIADWMADPAVSGFAFLEQVAEPFREYGRWAVGGAELLAVILVILPGTRRLGALLSLGIISGALFFHIVGPLGLATGGDYTLFGMAVAVFVSSLILLLGPSGND